MRIQRIIGLITVMLGISALGVAMLPGSASAYSPSVVGETPCIEGGTWTVTWTFQPATNRPEYVNWEYEILSPSGYPSGWIPNTQPSTRQETYPASQESATEVVTVRARPQGSDENPTSRTVQTTVPRPPECETPTTDCLECVTTTTTIAETTTTVAETTTTIAETTTTVAEVTTTVAETTTTVESEPPTTTTTIAATTTTVESEPPVTTTTVAALSGTLPTTGSDRTTVLVVLGVSLIIGGLMIRRLGTAAG